MQWLIRIRMLAALIFFCGCLREVACMTGIFKHGVASGDPLPGRVVIWTRVTPAAPAPDVSIQVGYKVWPSHDQRCASNGKCKTGTYQAVSEKDWTVKIDVSGLTPGLEYKYKFSQLDSNTPASAAESPIGTFKVPSKAGTGKEKELQYAVFSCANWGWGYFNAYDAASRLPLDFWVHLGDFIYEYGKGTYPKNFETVRGGLQPEHETVTLADYRTRLALYREDAGLQALSSTAALIAIWDDHEIADNARKESAKNHDPSEGSYTVRVQASVQAYHEWMPTRDKDLITDDYVGIFYNRTFQFGKLATVIATESRLTARSDEKPDLQPKIAGVVALTGLKDLTEAQRTELMNIKAEGESLANDPDYKLLGDAQLRWIKQETRKSADLGTKWQIYLHGTTMLDTLKFNFEAAITKMESSKPEVAAAWQAAYENVAYGKGPIAGTMYGAACHNLPLRGKPFTFPEEVRTLLRVYAASGSFSIYDTFDGWPGFQLEKKKFLSIVKRHARNAVQYGGDSHADWVGVQQLNGETVLAEFDVGSVTSTIYEADAFLPLDLLTAATEAAAYSRGLRKAYAEKKGFMYVTLNRDVHHAEYIHANKCSPSYKTTCDFAYDWFAKPGGGRGRRPQQDVVESRCITPTIVRE